MAVVERGSGQLARIRRAAHDARRILAHRPAGLLADIDGTLSAMVALPETAVVTPGVRRALRTLSRRLDLVVAVTGRQVVDARRLVGVNEIGYVGNHGIERWVDGAVTLHPLATPWIPDIAAGLKAARAAVDGSGMRFEDKGVSASVHYRLADDPLDAERRLLAALRPFVAAGRLRLTEGKMVVNLLPPVAIDKGRAVEDLAAEHGLRGVVFLGDDVTDLDALRALRRLRGRGIATLGIGVLSAEGPVELREVADVCLAGVDEVERLLLALARRPTSPTTG
ncbi:MAG: trehalose-phosphatase [Chloroflexi bacterium]|nr:trehalose-phosphatase [Chloroflexota bacterium]